MLVPDRRHGLIGVGRLADDLEGLLGFEQAPKTGADECVVVADEDLDR